MSTMYQNTATGFDRAAATYDSEEAGNRVLSRMREEHWRWFSRAFKPEARLLELGCGTGIEAARLAATGRRIALLDVAPRMLEMAAGRVKAVNPETLLGQHLLPASQMGELLRIYGKASFDGAYSSFGPLNCEPDLEGVGRGLAQLLKPGGRLIFSVMPRFCLTEMSWFALHGEFHNAARRLRGPLMARALPGEELLVKTFYYNPREFIRRLGPDFKVIRIKALPLLWPPPYLAYLPGRFPRLFTVLGKTDNWLTERFPWLAPFGDHYLIELKKL
ncbi:MAG TPA: class I SAM-dependent methyltransferase [Chloroflexia bacterium]|nr:class I SAM-dependent methyltransferase [Chloroflexia bacterium]